MTADGILGETSNLVIKGITGIYAMGKINQVLEATGADPNTTSYYLVSWFYLYFFDLSPLHRS